MTAPRTALAALGLISAAVAMAIACTPRAQRTPPSQCRLNSECTAPLICENGFCRPQCREDRDCNEAPNLCVREGDAGAGFCVQIECSEGVRCPAPAVCEAPGYCNVPDDASGPPADAAAD